jgi:signal transduction histidine kinase
MWQTILDPKVGFWRGEVMNRAKDGHLVPVLLTITPYREPIGEVVGYMGIAVDLSEQKRMESQLLRQDRLASIGLLASGLAHEIGNPLGTIQGRAEMLLEAVKGNAVAEKNVGVIVSQIDRISKLLHSLLRVSRVPESVHLCSVDLATIVDEVLTLMAEPLRRAQVDVKLSGLKKSVLGEPNHLQQLFLNLMINALHAIEDSQRSLETGASPKKNHFIEISAENFETRCVVSIRDSGCGIAPADQKKLFQPFFTTKAAGRGTGLGLAIVSKLIDEMNGEIFATSPGEGMGATFKISLKRNQEENSSCN